MKAYVIKNKEGLYARGKTLWVEEYEFASIFNNKEDAEKFRESIEKNYNEGDFKPKVVTLTISEGDLEEENRVLKKALELACKRLRAVAFNYDIRDCDVSYKMAQFVQLAKESVK